MPRHCQPFALTLSDGTNIKGFMCGTWPLHPKPEPCAVCGKPSVALCDFVVEERAQGEPHTCDRPLCRRHAVHPDPEKDIDYCPEHGEMVPNAKSV